MLKDRILNRETGIITYGLTPPKINNSEEKLIEISQKQIDRINSLDIDGLVLYDIQDESDRNADKRPFPFIETIDPVIYSRDYLAEANTDKIIYRCVGKYSEEELTGWIHSDNASDKLSVFVGAASVNQEIKLGLRDAYNAVSGSPNLVLGGVTIPERHMVKQDEHLKVISKMEAGCSYFISQVTYNAESAKNFLSDYYYTCQEKGLDMVPILFTLTPCGSVQTLNFMKWLGISIPKWLENDLKNSEDILDASVCFSEKVFKEIYEFASEKCIPIGCNIESLSVRKVEIDASVHMVNSMKALFNSN